MDFHLLAVGGCGGRRGAGLPPPPPAPPAENLRRPLHRGQRGKTPPAWACSPHHAEEIFAAGADVITLGNHTWGKRQILDTLEDNPYLLRPANFAPQPPRPGVWDLRGAPGPRIGILNLMGRFELDSNLDSPFQVADRILAGEGAEADLLFVDFHAEATSEKGAMGWYLDGRVQGCGAPHPRAHGGPPGPPPRARGLSPTWG